MTIDHRKVVALATYETPFVKRVDDIDDYQVTTTVTRYTKSVWLADRFKAAALDLNFAYNKSLTDSITGNNLVTFSRASSGTYVGADGLIKTSPVNLFTHSEQLNAWVVGSGSSVIANQAVAPNGTNTADRVQHGSGGSSWIRQDVLTSGVTYTVSVYAKAVTPGTNDQFTFDLGGLSSIFTATSEWQRFTFTGTASNASIYLNNGDDSFATDVYFWGAQVEEGDFATSYIATDSSTVTRAADLAEIAGTNFSSFYNSDSNQLGTMFVDASTNNSNNFDMVEISSGSIHNRDTIRHNVNDGVTALTSAGGGQTSQQYVSSGTASIKAAANSILGFAVNGTSTTDAGNQVNNNASMTQVAFGRRSTDNNIGVLNGHIKRFAYFSTNLDVNILKFITS